MKKRHRLFSKSAALAGAQKRAVSCRHRPFFCAVVHLFAPPRFPLPLKNIDFTGFSHVFLWQRPLGGRFFAPLNSAGNARMPQGANSDKKLGKYLLLSRKCIRMGKFWLTDGDVYGIFRRRKTENCQTLYQNLFMRWRSPVLHALPGGQSAALLHVPAPFPYAPGASRGIGGRPETGAGIFSGHGIPPGGSRPSK